MTPRRRNENFITATLVGFSLVAYLLAVAALAFAALLAPVALVRYLLS
jgi:hypothetical protein